MLGYAHSIRSFADDLLTWEAAERLVRGGRVPLKPLLYVAKGRLLLSVGTETDEDRMLRAIFGRPDTTQEAREAQFQSTMRHEIRHIIDNILDAQTFLPRKTVEVQACVYDSGPGAMRGFGRDVKPLQQREERLRKCSHGSVIVPESILQPVQSACRNLEEAAALCDALRRQHGRQLCDQALSYVFSLVSIEHLPTVLGAITRELHHQDGA